MDAAKEFEMRKGKAVLVVRRGGKLAPPNTFVRKFKSLSPFDDKERESEEILSVKWISYPEIRIVRPLHIKGTF